MSVPKNGRYREWAGEPKGRPRNESNCWEEIFPGGRELHRQCGVPWTVERNGERFCGTHDPEKVKAKRAAREAKWAAKAAADSNRYEREAAMRRACEGVATKDLKAGLLAKLLREARDAE